MTKMDMNKMLQQVQQMQEEMAKAQDELAKEVVEASVGGGMVKVKASGAGEIVEITISPEVIDPDDPEGLADLADDTLTVEFPSSASFHRQLAEEPKNATLLAEALYEVTGRRLGLAFAEGEARAEQADEDEEPAGEEKILELVKETLDARERED